MPMEARRWHTRNYLWLRSYDDDQSKWRQLRKDRAHFFIHIVAKPMRGRPLNGPSVPCNWRRDRVSTVDHHEYDGTASSDNLHAEGDRESYSQDRRAGQAVGHPYVSGIDGG